MSLVYEVVNTDDSQPLNETYKYSDLYRSIYDYENADDSSIIYVGLDFGTKCGVCILDSNMNILYMNSINFKDKQVLGMWHLLDQIVSHDSISKAILYEKVRAHRGQDAAHMYGGFEFITILMSYYNHNDNNSNTYLYNAGVSTIKKMATGYGRASKNDMKEAYLRDQAIYDTTYDDNAIDAFWMAKYCHTVHQDYMMRGNR